MHASGWFSQALIDNAKGATVVVKEDRDFSEEDQDERKSKSRRNNRRGQNKRAKNSEPTQTNVEANADDKAIKQENEQAKESQPVKADDVKGTQQEEEEKKEEATPKDE